jgi:glycogen operon protein
MRCSNSTVSSPQICSQDSDCGSGNQCVSFEEFKRQQMRNLFVAMLFSNGTPLLLGGDEWMRTQLGNNNAYSNGADNPYNWYQWGEWQPDTARNRMHDFVRQLIHWRLAHLDVLAPDSYGPAPTWLDETGSNPPNWGSKHLMVSYPATGGSPALAFLVNMEGGNVNYTLPAGHSWNRVLDTQLYFDTDDYLTAQGLPPNQSANIDTDPNNPSPVGNSYGVPGHSIVILEAAP